jgi:hypothetical protein
LPNIEEDPVPQKKSIANMQQFCLDTLRIDPSGNCFIYKESD